MRVHLMMLLLFAACSPEPSDLIACTEIGCVDGIAVELKKPVWQPGIYTIRVTHDGQTQSCEVSLPFVGCDIQPCQLQNVTVGLSGCALPAEQHAITSVQTMTADFEEKEVEVLYEGVSIGSKKFRPRFSATQPNGPNCPPTCHQAPTEELVLN